MARAIAGDRLPRPALAGIAALVAFTLGVTAVYRLGGQPPMRHAEGSVVDSRLLRFSDRPEGGIRVEDATDGSAVLVIYPGEDGFVRGVLRGLARERRSHEIGAHPPFRLARLADGRLTIEDTATGRRIDLAAFGPTNAGAFARFLNREEKRP